MKEIRRAQVSIDWLSKTKIIVDDTQLKKGCGVEQDNRLSDEVDTYSIISL
jgi:hypothetical protein